MPPLPAIPGLLSAAITDDAGQVLGFQGEGPPPSAAVLVLAQATLGAASELGRRSGSGDCVELVQQHEGGLILLRGLSNRRVLLLRCLPGTDMAAVSQAAAVLDTETPAAPPRPAFEADISLADAFLASPKWD